MPYDSNGEWYEGTNGVDPQQEQQNWDAFVSTINKNDPNSVGLYLVGAEAHDRALSNLNGTPIQFGAPEANKYLDALYGVGNTPGPDFLSAVEQSRAAQANNFSKQTGITKDLISAAITIGGFMVGAGALSGAMGGAGLGATGIGGAAPVGAGVSTEITPSTLGIGDAIGGAAQAGSPLAGTTFAGAADAMAAGGAAGAGAGTLSNLATQPPAPTGGAGDWYLGPDGTPIPSGSAITPAGGIVPGGTPGSDLLAPPPGTYSPLSPANPLPGTDAAGNPITPGTPGTGGAPGTGGTPNPGGSPNINWGGLLSSLAGIYGANQQTQAYKDIADRSWNAGQASRDRYQASMTPGFNAMDIPGYKSAFDTGVGSYLSKLSMTGNPANRGGAMGDTLSYVMGTTGLPAIQNYQKQNAESGALSSIAATGPQAAQNAIVSQGGQYGQLGNAINSLFGNQVQNTPPVTLASLAQQFPGLKFTG